MVTDLHRLERAARLAMGDFEAAPDTAPPPRRPYLSSRFALPLAMLAVLAGAAILLS